MPDIISWSDAKAQGLKLYFTGEPCRRGHVAERQTSGRHCLECRRERAEQRWSDPEIKERMRGYAREYYARCMADPDKLEQRRRADRERKAFWRSTPKGRETFR